jgi:acetyl-CoA carboxylase biotin carboxyl carrier protein
LDLKEIKELIALMRRNELSEFELETEGFHIKLKKGGEPVVSHSYFAAPAGQPPPALPPPAAAPASGGVEPKGPEITSPMVGTFYSAPSPDAKAYVEVGTEVTEETVVCIIEAMKVMNEIKAETRGVITEILAETGKPVQYGQTMFRLK